MKASEAMALYLKAHGVTHCFELIGGMITHLVDSLVRQGGIRVISMHHEQAAAFAAEGVSRATQGRELGLAMGTSGPGATNLITGIASCWFDSVPCLFITGQVNTNELKGDRPIRQQGFQELDVVSVVRPITKFAAQVPSEDQLLPMLHRALSTALSDRRGPVLLDIPNNVQRNDVPDSVVEEWIRAPLEGPAIARIPSSDLDRLRELCAQSNRPLVVFGGGAKESSRADEWRSQLSKIGIPYVSTLLGQERIAFDPLYFGMIGSYGNRTANWAVQRCDFLLVLGARLDVRQTGADVANFAPTAKIAQLDIDLGQLNNRVKVDLPMRGTVDEFYATFSLTNGTFSGLDSTWTSQLRGVRERVPGDEYSDWSISPSDLMHALSSAYAGHEVQYVCDVGNHQMWAAHSLVIGPGQRIFHSGGLGSMGFSLPTAIGVSLRLGKTVVVAGDGGIQVNFQEMDTLRRLDLDLSIVVLNNRSLGMVKNFQDMYFQGRDYSTRTGYSAPNFVELAKAYGIAAELVVDTRGAESAFRRIASRRGPYLIEISMDGATECRPRLTFGSRLDNQHPSVTLEG